MSEVVIAVLVMTGLLLLVVLAPWRGRKDALSETEVYTVLAGEEPDDDAD